MPLRTVVVLCVAVLVEYAAAENLVGTRLVLRDVPERPKKRLASVRSADPAITIGLGNDSTDDPTVHGGVLRFQTSAGDGFVAEYDLPAAQWRTLGPSGRNRGYRFKGRGAVRNVVVKPGRLVKALVRGPGTGHSVRQDPAPVDVILTMGGHRHCLSFGGVTEFTPNEVFRASDAPASPRCGQNRAPWPMHQIDSRFRGANALSAADVDGDGFTDYVTNYEFDQRYVIALHPGLGGDVRKPWPTIIPFDLGLTVEADGVDTEHAALGDMDGDGNLDVIGAQGSHPTTTWEGDHAGIRLVWGPPTSQVTNESLWVDGGRIPATIDQGHFLFVVPHDVNGDGRLDIVCGGRVHWETLSNARLRWVEAPAPPADRRDLSLWTMHDIDPLQLDGHGFVLTDVDVDGDLDIADANADFDTPENEETVHWYENPGTGSPAQELPWTKHELFRSDEFYAKPSMTAADLDQDGLVDLLTQSDHRVLWFRKTAIEPVTFETVIIPKPALTDFRARPLRVADVNGDARLDLVGMMTHDDGLVPADTASVFWMEYEGPVPAADNWTTHVIKWGSEFPMEFFTFGEKWDQVQFDDVDGDGDVDILANNEEWWVNGPNPRGELAGSWDPKDPTALSVVWFENRVTEPPIVGCRETAGACVIEAERWTTTAANTWLTVGKVPGFAGDGYAQFWEKRDLDGKSFGEDPGVHYVFDVAGGTYNLWVRRLVPTVWGHIGLGGAASNSAWLSIDGATPSAPIDDGAFTPDTWEWVEVAVAMNLGAGAHTLDLSGREGGYMVDRLLLTTDLTLTPTGIGP